MENKAFFGIRENYLFFRPSEGHKTGNEMPDLQDSFAESGSRSFLADLTMVLRMFVWRSTS